MPRKRNHFTLLNFLSLFPLWTAMLGLLVAGHGWIQNDPERIHQGFALTFVFQGCVLLVGALLAVNGVRSLAIWFFGKF